MQIGCKPFGVEAKHIAQMLEKTHRQEDTCQLQETALSFEAKDSLFQNATERIGFTTN